MSCRVLNKITNQGTEVNCLYPPAGRIERGNDGTDMNYAVQQND